MSQPPPGQWPPPWAPYPPPRPPKKTPAGAIVAISLAVAVVLTVTLIITLNSGSSGSSSAASYDVTDSPTPTTTTTSSSASSTSTTTRTTSSSSETTTATASGPHKIIALAGHPLMADPNAGLSNAGCTVPGWPSSPAASQAFFTAAAQCLNARWGQLLEAMDLPFHPPQLEFPAGPSFTTACGTINVGLSTAAYYCKDHLYVPYRGLQTDQYGDKPGVYLALFAHEYGHHVQDLVGLMDAVWQVIYADGQQSQGGLEMSRRKELQAQCFSGMFMGATANRGGTITQNVFDVAWNDQQTRGDDTSGSDDHGTNAHYAEWWRKGAESDRLAQCNTFAAPSSDVS
ncbi:neutral zinc metallopeptidase [Amycolatopsis alkalitolerans]|uniref:Metalloprotease n=1 Tax=Amycolatopsis alkalitolerans TaxID=2547244 RepID=A0A5C4LV13_9PSEU|nr:neutral zinc metallopeptidase [Amycolatopsis alkalitolerans]TNC23158.1 metalloprotease [Amycolatopsis alkalitolerans]